MHAPNCSGCNNYRRGERYTQDQCRICWVKAHRRKHSAAAVRARSTDAVPTRRKMILLPPDRLEAVPLHTSRCANLGEPTGESIECPNCGRDNRGKPKVRLALYTCKVYGNCTLSRKVDGAACCAGTSGPLGNAIPCTGYRPGDTLIVAEIAVPGASPVATEGVPASPRPSEPVPTDARVGASAGALTRARIGGREVTLYPVPPLPPGEEREDGPSVRFDPLPAAPAPPDPKPLALEWAYGVTTVPGRSGDLLPRTLTSLRRGGFANPVLFVDGLDHRGAAEWEDSLGLEVVNRNPTQMVDGKKYGLRAYGNWVLALAELYIRRPHADRYALFQDDLVTCLNLRAYLDRAGYPDRGYLNLYTFPSNHQIVPKERNQRVNGWHPSNQWGKGAVALVFDLAAVQTLLTYQPEIPGGDECRAHLVSRPTDKDKGHKRIDGGVVDSMKKAGWSEYIHHPSLIQHTGRISAIGNKPHPQSPSFPGEEFDALTLLKEELSALPERPGQGRDYWRREVEAITRAIADDRRRMAEAKTPNDRAHFSKLVKVYEGKLAHARKMAAG